MYKWSLCLLILSPLIATKSNLLANQPIYSDHLREGDMKNLPTGKREFLNPTKKSTYKTFKRGQSSLGDEIAESIQYGMETLKNRAKESGKALLDSVIGNDMQTQCFMSPTNCAVAKDARRHGTMIADIMERKLSDLDQFLGEGGRVLKESFAKCVSAKLDAGTSKSPAYKACEKAIRGENSILDFSTGNLSRHHQGVIEDSLKLGGIPKTETVNHVKNLLKLFVGDPQIQKIGEKVDFKNNYGFALDENLNQKVTRQKHPMDTGEYMQKIQSYYREQICQPILRDGTRFLNNPTRIEKLISDLNTGAVKGAFHTEVISSFRDIAPANRRGECIQLANSYGRLRFSRESSQVRQLGKHVLRNPHLSESTRKIVSRRLENFAASAHDQLTIFEKQDDILGEALTKIRRQSASDKEKKANLSYREKAMARTERKMENKLSHCSVETGEGCI